MARIIGIDLGTTNSCVATLERGTPAVLASRDGERTTPSAVAFSSGNEIVVGRAAKRQAVTNPTRTVFGTKRLIGRKVNAPDVQRFAQNAPFGIVAAPNGDAWVRLDAAGASGEICSPQEISSFVLERMRWIAEEALGEPVTQAVITVPAYFDDAQRQATRDAGTIAGLDVRRILNEPTAAALAFGAHRLPDCRRLAIFDLGGGTFDISILHVEHGVFEVLATNGDNALGGDDFDRRIVEWLVGRCQQQHATDPTLDPVALGRLREEAEQAKKTLSAETTVAVRLPFFGQSGGGDPVHLDESLSRETLEDLTG
ncbi:MAG: Hsp70 family protein, partial [Pseudomonadota bacterium]